MTVRSPGPRAAKDDETTLALLVRAVDFAADRHRDQRRKDEEASPYINHPIKVANELTRVGGVTDPDDPGGGDPARHDRGHRDDG